uniref:Nebulette n=5 Tax=Pseudocrenilabrinae TaxID=318546 RepID=A0A3Q4GS13_NEOBR
MMRNLTSSVTETPEIVLARENAKKISDVRYREEVGCGTAVMDTPEMERVRRNQENISSVKYKQSAVKATSVGVTPELERVKQNQENISSVKYQRGLQEVRGRSCNELDTPEYRRVRKTQDSVSMVAAWLLWFPPVQWEELTQVMSDVAPSVGPQHGY